MGKNYSDQLTPMRLAARAAPDSLNPLRLRLLQLCESTMDIGYTLCSVVYRRRRAAATLCAAPPPVHSWLV